MSTKHTPRPWRYKKSDGDIHKHAVFGPPHPKDGGDYAPLARFSKQEDAQLCAAAPELLEALDILLTLFGQAVFQVDACDKRDVFKALAAARAAVEKAGVL